MMASILIVADQMERRANEEAASSLVPKVDMDSFVLRVGPLYSKDRINRFANRMKIHPGIIVGQLQRRKEIGYSSNREMLAKIRHFVTPAAVTDGWGHSIDSRSLK
jgi:HTH-type transcriptional regulator/antitoxin HigA